MNNFGAWSDLHIDIWDFIIIVPIAIIAVVLCLLISDSDWLKNKSRKGNNKGGRKDK